MADFYRETVDALAAQGIVRYEISNFARAGHESRHNAKYWDDAPFLGFGMSAHSYRAGCRFWNDPTYGGYCTVVERGGARAARAGERVLSSTELVGEALFTGLRRAAGVSLPAFRGRYGVDPLAAYGSGLAPSFEAGLLEVSGERLRLTEKGVLLSNEVFRAFV